MMPMGMKKKPTMKPGARTVGVPKAMPMPKMKKAKSMFDAKILTRLKGAI